MQREVLHPIHCPCSACRHPAEEQAHPDQLALGFGLLAGVAFGALLGAGHLLRILAGWLVQS